MLRRIASEDMGSSNLGWLRSKFHFSFAEYYKPDNIHFGVLRVINDDLIGPQTGFDLHPHQDMEIVSYVVDGELTHEDSMGNKSTLGRGMIQYMSAGTGVNHSEHNRGDVTLRLLQIWIFPDKKGYPPHYGENRFAWEDRMNRWLHMVSGQDGNAPVRIHQDCNLYSMELEKGKKIEFPVGPGRQAYLMQIEGSSDINGLIMETRDGLEITEEDLVLRALETSHLLVIDMPKS